MPGDPPMAGPILSATVTVGDLARSLRAYGDGLGLEPVWQGTIPTAVAAAWEAPALAGAMMAVLQPRDAAADAPGAIRLVAPADGLPGRPVPLASHGWAAAEFSVIDPDALLPTACAHGFECLGPPAPLGSNPAIRATQIAGPDGEVFYLTDIRAYDGALDLHAATRPVDRCFIAVLATPNLPAERRALERAKVGRRVTDRPVTVPVLNRSLGLPADTMTRISSLQLADGCLIEIDGYPDPLPSRPMLGDWPTGVAMITVADPQAPAPVAGSPIALGRIERLCAGARLERVGRA